MTLTRFGAACVELWNAGKSAGVIAAELSVRFGKMTRSAVMGQVHRARLLGVKVDRRHTTRARVELPNQVRERERRRLAEGRARVVKHKKLRDQSGNDFDMEGIVTIALPTPTQPPAPLPFIELGSRGLQWHAVDGCTMLLGDDAEHPQWCNAPVWGSSDWCAYHYRRVYRGAAER